MLIQYVIFSWSVRRARVFCYLLRKQLHLLHSKELQDVALGVYHNNIMGGSVVRPGRESAFMGQGETFIPALPTIAGTREPRRKLWGGRLPAALRNTQVSQTAAPIQSDVRAGNGIP